MKFSKSTYYWAIKRAQQREDVARKTYQKFGLELWNRRWTKCYQFRQKLYDRYRRELAS